MRKYLFIAILILIAVGIFSYIKIQGFYNDQCKQVIYSANAMFMKDDYSVCGKNFKLYNRGQDTIELEKYIVRVEESSVIATPTGERFELESGIGMSIETDDEVAYVLTNQELMDVQLTNEQTHA